MSMGLPVPTCHICDMMLLFMPGILQRTFRHWYAARDSAIVWRLKFERAVVRHNNRLVSSSFNRWRAYVALSRRKQLLCRQCIWLLETRLVASHFLRWRAVFAARQHENTRSMSALWHWSVVLQHKVGQCLVTCSAYVLFAAVIVMMRLTVKRLEFKSGWFTSPIDLGQVVHSHVPSLLSCIS